MKAKNVLVGRSGQEGLAGPRVIAAAEKVDPQTFVADLLDLVGGEVRPGDLLASVPKMGDSFRGGGMGLIVRTWLYQKMGRVALLHLFRACWRPVTRGRYQFRTSLSTPKV